MQNSPSEENFNQPENIINFSTPSKTEAQPQYINPLQAQNYRNTGECNDPALKTVIKRLHAGEALLSPKRANRLLTALLKSVKIIEKAASSLKERIEDIETAISTPENNQTEAAINLEHEIDLQQNKLDLGISQILKITRKHGYSVKGKNDPQPKEESKQTKELTEEITYFQHFLLKQCHLSVADFEQSSYPKAYFRRIKEYLNLLPGSCRLLVSITRQSIFDKVPGTAGDDLTL